MDRLDATRGRSPVPGPPRGFAPIVHTPGGSPRSSTHQGVRHPRFLPGLWSTRDKTPHGKREGTGPTAWRGTGERLGGARDKSRGKNPWAAKPRRPQTPPTPRKGSNKLFQRFRRLGKAGKPVGYPSPARTRANFPASAEAVRRHPPSRFSRTESRTITLNPRFYGRLH